VIVFNGGQDNTSSCNTTAQHAPITKYEVGLRGATQLVHGRKTQNTSLSEPLNYFYTNLMFMGPCIVIIF
jgi:hypothetical protein